MTVIIDHSLLHLNVELAGNQTECLLDGGAIIALYPVSDALTKI